MPVLFSERQGGCASRLNVRGLLVQEKRSRGEYGRLARALGSSELLLEEDELLLLDDKRCCLPRPPRLVVGSWSRSLGP